MKNKPQKRYVARWNGNNRELDCERSEELLNPSLVQSYLVVSSDFLERNLGYVRKEIRGDDPLLGIGSFSLNAIVGTHKLTEHYLHPTNLRIPLTENLSPLEVSSELRLFKDIVIDIQPKKESIPEESRIYLPRSYPKDPKPEYRINSSVLDKNNNPFYMRSVYNSSTDPLKFFLEHHNLLCKLDSFGLRTFMPRLYQSLESENLIGILMRLVRDKPVKCFKNLGFEDYLKVYLHYVRSKGNRRIIEAKTGLDSSQITNALNLIKDYQKLEQI